MSHRSSTSPDLVIVGAARSGTSFLSATLANHPGIDAGAVKEPNFYSSRWDEGEDWYDGLFQPRDRGLLRVDGSVSYTYPQHPLALERLRDANPAVQIVYTVREPLTRLVSHYQLFRHYYEQDGWRTLGESIDRSAMFLGAGDYAHWLGRLADLFPREQVLVVPFPATTSDVGQTTNLLLSRLGLPASDIPLEAPAFRNEVREFRVPGLHGVHHWLQNSRAYPTVRSAVGADRLRRLRQRMTRPSTLPTAAEELRTLTREQRERVHVAATSAADAVSAWLPEQDERVGTQWAGVWARHLEKVAPD